MHFQKKSVLKTLILIFCLSLVLSSCAKQDSDSILLGMDDSFTQTILKKFPQYKLHEFNSSQKKSVFYYANNGNLIECLDVQAESFTRENPEYSFYPQSVVTVVLAIDRDKTSANITSWSDLLNEIIDVSFPDNDPFLRTAFASVAYGQDGKYYTKDSAVTFLKKLQHEDRLKYSQENCPVTICFDSQAVQMKKSGKNIDIVIPKDGTLSFKLGLLSKSPIQNLSEQELLNAGLRLSNGKADLSLYPNNEEYKTAFQISNYSHFNNVTENSVRVLRREIQNTHLFSSADGKEHILSFIGVCLLIIAWTASALYRCYRKDVRKCIILISLICISWMLVSLLKYQLPYGFLSRICWYTYYIPLLSLPLLTLYISIKIDKPYGTQDLPKWFFVFALLCPILIIMVFTNDFHQQVFHFTSDINQCNDYTYAIGYYGIFAYCLFTFLLSVVFMTLKSQKSSKHFAALLPAFVALLIVVYSLEYMYGMPIARNSNYSFVFCLLTILFLEAALQVGLVPTNIRYKKLLVNTPLHIQLLNEKGIIEVNTDEHNNLTQNECDYLTSSPGSVLQKDINTLLHSCKIKGGVAVWQEDISAINKLHNEIEKSVQKLQSTNILLQKENKVKHEKTSAQIKAQLLAMLEEDLKEKDNMLNKLVKNLPENETVTGHEIACITLLLCYIKRRSNLFFLSQEGNQMSGVELTVYLDELSEFSFYAGVHALVRCVDIGNIDIKASALYYDLYFSMVFWAAKESSATLIGQLNFQENALIFSVLSSIKTDTLHLSESFYRAAETSSIKIEHRSNEDYDGIYLISEVKGDV